jgi:hypothetical protein
MSGSSNGVVFFRVTREMNYWSFEMSTYRMGLKMRHWCFRRSSLESRQSLGTSKGFKQLLEKNSLADHLTLGRNLLSTHRIQNENFQMDTIKTSDTGLELLTRTMLAC